MKTFVYLFPPGLVLSLFIMSSLFGESVSGLLYLIILPWLLIAPLIGRKLESPTTTAVDRLVRGMAEAKPK